jgi:hypothetical protein
MDFSIQPACDCESPQARGALFEHTFIGIDQTTGRFADVSLQRCRSCEKDWVHYFVEYEAFSHSGRWARGIVSAEEARSITPEIAAEFLHGLPWYLYGGSHFGGIAGRKSGPMNWSP